MLKTITSIILVLIAVVAGFYLSSFLQTNSGHLYATVNRALIPAPKELVIPSLQVRAPIEAVGKTEDGAMDVPQNVWNVAWYEPGPKPGEKGQAVIAGHYDSKTGPAVFVYLSKLQLGDEVQIIDTSGKTKTFVVYNKEIYDRDSFPISQVFGDADAPYLNLITCDGIFNKQAETYSKRIVVFTRLKPS